MLNQGYREIINIATLASLIGEWWTLRVQFQNPCLNYHPPECSDEVILWLPSIRPKFLWVVCKTMIRLKDFKAREKKSVLCFVLQNYVSYSALHTFIPILVWLFQINLSDCKSLLCVWMCALCALYMCQVFLASVNVRWVGFYCCNIQYKI